MMSRKCQQCGRLAWSITENEWTCGREEECCPLDGPGFKLFIDKSEFESVVDAEWLATAVAQTIYSRAKGKIFTVLESQIDKGQKLEASKHITQDIIAGISKDVANFIKDVLGDWQQEVIAGGECSPEDEKQARKEYDEIQEIIR